MFLPLVMDVALATRFALPPDALLHIGPRQYVGTSPGNEKQMCLNDRSTPMTATAMRRRFRTFHELREGEAHDFYLWFGCEVRGTVTVDGRQFHWTYEYGNTMWTNYPDGRDHQLGGKYTDDPSEGERR